MTKNESRTGGDNDDDMPSRKLADFPPAPAPTMGGSVAPHLPRGAAVTRRSASSAAAVDLRRLRASTCRRAWLGEGQPTAAWEATASADASSAPSRATCARSFSISAAASSGAVTTHAPSSNSPPLPSVAPAATPATAATAAATSPHVTVRKS